VESVGDPLFELKFNRFLVYYSRLTLAMSMVPRSIPKPVEETKETAAKGKGAAAKKGAATEAPPEEDEANVSATISEP
jgi:hypothetical protein